MTQAATIFPQAVAALQSGNLPRARELCEALLREGHAVWAFDNLHPFYPVAAKERNLAEVRTTGGAFTFVLGELTEPTALRNLFQISTCHERFVAKA